jgi:cyclase
MSAMCKWVVVFDTFLTPQAALDLRMSAEDLTGHAPRIVVNGHYHNDHIWGNQVFMPEAQIIASACTRDLMATAGMEEFQWYLANSEQRLEAVRAQYQNTDDEQQRGQLAMWIGYYGGLVEAMPHLAVCTPTVTFDSRLEMHGPRYTAQLIAFEGAHTGSDTVLHLPQAGIVFMSDLLFVGCHPYLADGDPLLLLDALGELSQLEATRFVPGHGPVGSREDLSSMRAYVETCLETAQRLVKEGNAYGERIAEPKIPEAYRHWQMAQFFHANIRFLCQRLDAAGAGA